MRKIISHLKENWIRYGFETFVVVSSILIAFSLNTWSDGIKAKNAELKLLRELKQDLETNYEEISGIRERTSTLFASVDSAIIYLDNSYEIKHDIFWFLALPWAGIFNNANTAYEQIKNGGLNVLNNDSIRIQTTFMYENQFYNHKNRELKLQEFYNSEIRPFRMIHFKSSYQKDELGFEPVNIKLLRSNLQFLNILTELKVLHKSRGDHMDRTLVAIKKLISKIEEEIKGLKNS